MLDSDVFAPSERLAFCFELRKRINEVTGLKWTHGHHSGAARWLANRLNVAEMTAGRYLRGRALPTPKIALKMSEVLSWNYFDMVQTIIKVELRNRELNLLRKYSLK
jgi:hypothetical protein